MFMVLMRVPKNSTCKTFFFMYGAVAGRCYSFFSVLRTVLTMR